MAYAEIISLQNQRIKDTIRLRDRRARDKTDKFLIEGFRELSRAVGAGRRIDSLFICPAMFTSGDEEELVSQLNAQGIQIFKCPPNVFEKLSYREGPDGLLAVAPQFHLGLNDLSLPKAKAPLLVIAEAIEKPGNLGTILRTSDGVGADAVIVCDRCTDIHNPNIVRASMGTLFTVPVVETSGDEALAWLKKQGIKILAATPHAKIEYTEADLTVPVAIAFGTEQQGLSDEWMHQADIQVKIPMLGIADSLNVAMSASLLLYEALRQRSKK